MQRQIEDPHTHQVLSTTIACRMVNDPVERSRDSEIVGERSLPAVERPVRISPDMILSASRGQLGGVGALQQHEVAVAAAVDMVDQVEDRPSFARARTRQSIRRTSRSRSDSATLADCNAEKSSTACNLPTW